MTAELAAVGRVEEVIADMVNVACDRDVRKGRLKEAGVGQELKRQRADRRGIAKLLKVGNSEIS